MSTCSPMTIEINWGTLGVPWVPVTTSSIEPMACKAAWQPGANTATAAALKTCRGNSNSVTFDHHRSCFAATGRVQLWLTVGHDQRCWLSLRNPNSTAFLLNYLTKAICDLGLPRLWSDLAASPIRRKCSALDTKLEKLTATQRHTDGMKAKIRKHHEHPSNPWISLSLHQVMSLNHRSVSLSLILQNSEQSLLN